MKYYLNFQKYRFKSKILKFIFIFFSIYIIFLTINKKKFTYYKKRIGVINMHIDQNVGNILVKYSLYKKLKELKLEPIIIAKSWLGVNISFLNRTVNLKLIKDNLYELNRSDYDALILNSDQTWAYFDKPYFYEYAFLKFAENWNIPKIIYGASMGKDKWFYTYEEEEMGKYLLKNFTGISFREIGLVKLAEQHLNIRPSLVLDPTFIIDKSYYLEEIKNFKREFNFNENYLFVYILDENNLLDKFINEICIKFKYKIYKLNVKDNYYIENFIFGVNISKAVITDSYHGTVFSIIFNKPFISYVNIDRGKGRFDSLIEIFNLSNRIIYPMNFSKANISLLSQPLNINKSLFNELKKISIQFLKKNLGIT